VLVDAFPIADVVLAVLLGSWGLCIKVTSGVVVSMHKNSDDFGLSDLSSIATISYTLLPASV
jgi:hypothetical protein